jgi:hypothetical protein
VKINLQTEQFRFKDRRNKLTNRAVKFKTDANTKMNLHTNQFT